MARAAFNNTFDVYWGPRSAFPNVLKAQIPGRYVRRRWIVPQTTLMRGMVGWITTASFIPTASQVTWPGSDVLLWKGTEDRLACPRIGLAPTPMLYYDTISHPGITAYVRIVIGFWPNRPP